MRNISCSRLHPPQKRTQKGAFSFFLSFERARPSDHRPASIHAYPDRVAQQPLVHLSFASSPNSKLAPYSSSRRISSDLDPSLDTSSLPSASFDQPSLRALPFFQAWLPISLPSSVLNKTGQCPSSSHFLVCPKAYERLALLPFSFPRTRPLLSYRVNCSFYYKVSFSRSWSSGPSLTLPFFLFILSF
jgi:hypothetical protein